MINLRYYQKEAIDAIYNYFANNSGNPLVAMPTGTGKAYTIAAFLHSVFEHFPRQKILVVSHVKEILVQDHKSLKRLWPQAPCSINSAGLKERDFTQAIIFCGIASIAKRYKEFKKVDLVIIDEAHLVSPNEKTMYQTLINGLLSINPYLKVIGFTATPWRLGQGCITSGGLFTDICYDLTNMEAFNRLIDEGYLCRLIPKKTATAIDTDTLHIRGGEFIQAEVQQVVDKAVITNAALDEALDLAPDRNHWLIFATGIEHAQHIAEALTIRNITSACVHSKMPDKERDDTIARFKSGAIRAIVNVGVLTTGFDFPEIDLIIMLRPTASPVLWVQMLGRGTRPAEGKTDCLVLDFAGNTRRLGPINDPVVPKKKGSKGGEAPVKLCERCGCYAHASSRICEHCGFEFTFKVKIQHTASYADIIRNDTIRIEIFQVDHVIYVKHQKDGRPDTLKVSYYCGLRTFKEFVCFEHEGFARRRAVEWWTKRVEAGLTMRRVKDEGKPPIPDKIDDALEESENLKIATHIRVRLDQKYPEILSHCFDGTAFNTISDTKDQQFPIDNQFVSANMNT